MLRVLRDKFLRLGRDDDGVALVTTLAIFMFMYLVCMGVYAIGAAVKTRVHLQNACDAAAYSAAVVQADTLSRIATINRAMAWTYIAMSRRQMDYIVDRWLEHTVEHYDDDKSAAISWYYSGSPCCFWKGNHSWQTGFGPNITLNNHRSTTEMDIMFARMGYSGHLVGQAASFYASQNMETQIDQDKRTIREMNRAISDLIRGGSGHASLQKRIEIAVNDVLEANLPDNVRNRCRRPFFIRQNSDPLSEGSGYLRMLRNEVSDRGDENRFSAFVRQNGMATTLGEGARDGQWFVRGNGSRSTEGAKGLQRSYRHWSLGNLQSKWTWSSYRWICTDPKYHVGGYLDGIKRCRHPLHDSVRCRCSGGTGTFRASVYGDNNRIWNDRYVGERAEPYILTEDYFAERGTITVGIACENQNPWVPVLGNVARGLFSAFSIGRGMDWTPQYMVCFASAKAGYKYIDEDVDNRERAYRIDWKDVSWSNAGQKWNLCQSDLDAVLIPVRRAETLASGGAWGSGNLNFLEGYARELGVRDTDMRAGGNGLDLSRQYGNRNLGEEYRFGNKLGFWGGNGSATQQDDTGKVRAKWQIQNANRPVRWGELERVMLH